MALVVGKGLCAVVVQGFCFRLYGFGPVSRKYLYGPLVSPSP